MGWKGTVRSVGSLARQIERDSNRRAKELQKSYDLQEARSDAGEYEEYIAGLISLHKECREICEWQRIKDEESPNEPTKKQSL